MLSALLSATTGLLSHFLPVTILGWVTLIFTVILPTIFFLMNMDRSQNLPPRVPFLLDALSGKFNLKAKGPNDFIRQSYEKYGDVFRVKLAYRDIVFVVGPKAHEVMYGNQATDEVMSLPEVYGFTVPVFGRNIVYDCPVKVMQQQLKFVGKGLTGTAMEAHCLKIVKETEDFFKSYPQESTVDLFDAFCELTIRTASRCLLGNAFRERINPKEFAQLYTDLEHGMNHVSFFFPTLPTAKHHSRDIARDKIKALFLEAIRERRASKTREDDFLQVLIDSKYTDGTTNTDDQIAGLTLSALFGGQHTSSITSTWVAVELCRNSSLFPRLLSEQKEILAKHNNLLTLDSLAEMTLLNSTVREVLRMYPPLILLMRKVRQDVKYRDFTIPSGAIIVSSPPVAHRVAEVYKNPDTFNPDRFMGENPEGKEKFSFITFGAGRHGCLGERFAFLQIKMIYSVVVRNFNLELLDKDPAVDYEHIVAGPAPPIRCKFTRK